MYEKYIQEREGKKMLKHEHGFAIYGYNCVPGADFQHVYIQDVYVLPECRKRGYAKQMRDQICFEANKRGIHVLLTGIDTRTAGAHESLLTQIACGMKLHAASGAAIWFRKGI